MKYVASSAATSISTASTATALLTVFAALLLVVAQRGERNIITATALLIVFAVLGLALAVGGMAETNPVAFAQQDTATFDFEFDLDSTNGSPTGITALNDKIWVADPSRDKVFVYNATDGTRNSSSDFGLALDNANTHGMTALNNKFWVVDASSGTKKVWVYNADGTNDSSSNFNLISDITNPRGIIAHDGKLLIVDGTSNKVYAYNANGNRDASSDFDLDITFNPNPGGITSLHGKLWVVVDNNNTVYAYNSDGTRDAASNLDLDADNRSPTGITSLYGKLWVSDDATNKVYVYNVSAPDNTAPTLALVTIVSDNSNDPSLATTDDIVTLRFTASENIRTPTVTFGGVVASTVTGSNTSWSATKTITSGDADGPVAFTIAYSNLATNAGTTVTSTDDNTSVTIDQTAPTLTAVSITSDNSNDSSLATTGNTVTLSFTSSENIRTPTVTFGGVTASTVTGSNTSWSATKTITSGDADGLVAFSISYSDLATNAGTPVTSTIGGSSVTIDQTAPTLTAVTIASDHSNDSSLAITDDTVTLSFTSSENILPPTVTFGGVAASAVAVGSNTSWSATKTITSGDADGLVIFTISYSDLATNTGITVTSTDDNTSVTIDQMAPTLAPVSITSNNSESASLATTDDTVTLSFTSSENILPPTVTFGGVTASTVTGSNTSWSATKTITGADADGLVIFTIAYSDLATNTGITVTSTDDNTSVTIDQTAPTLTAVSITSDNSNDSSLATTDDTVTLSFTSSENILPPTVTFGGVTASTVTGSNTSWSATKTITGADADGLVAFSISYSDLATNTGTPVTSTIGGSSVTIDQTAPTLAPVSITSDNSNPSLATTDDTVTLSFTSSENILPPTVTFGGVTASTVTGSNTSWSATKTITDSDVDGSTVMFAIDYSDLATNDGITVTGVTDGTSVIVDQPAPDTTAPTLTAVSITSDNSNDSSLATTDDTVTLSFTSSENILPPTVTFGGVTASTVTGSNTSWSATKTITSGDADGPVIFTIAYSDLATNTGTPVTSTDDNTSVTIDQMAPTLTAVSITSNNSNDSSLATTGNTVTLSFTSSEGILPPTVTFGGVAASAVAVGSNTSWSATKTIVPEDADGPVAFSISYSDLATNTGTPVTSTIGGSSVTIDQTAPTLAPVSITSNNPNPSLATTDDTVTLSFTSSENILPPTVTFGGVTASTVTGSNTSWSATKTITDSDVDGSTVAFTIDYSDLATNAGTPVTGVTDGTGVTVDQPAPDTTAPTLAPVSITSNNSESASLATTGNTVTLSFTSSENILPPTVTFGGVTASTVTGSNTSWSATKTITSGDADGPVIFTIAYSDLATNTGTPVTSTDDNTSVTIDQMAPTLTAVSITSNNSNDSSLATTGNTVTLSFTSSEGILPPTVTFGGVAASAVAVGSNTSWSATKTIVPEDADGPVAFSISYSDLATNTGTPVTSTIGGSSVTIDQTAPTLAPVSITSDNPNPSLATTDDTVTLSFTSSENILPPTVTFGGVTASTVTGSNTSWSATKTITSGDADGPVIFTIAYSDLATNTGTPVTSTDDNTSVTIDQMAPTLTAVSITSNNSNDSSLATTGNTVTLSFTSSEGILPPTVTFGGVAASAVAVGSNTSWSATKTIVPEDADGLVAFSISYSDLATNDGTPVTSTIGGSSVTIDQTAPTLALVSITSNNSNPSLATTDDTVTLSFTSSENILPPTVTFGGVTASTVTGSNTSWSATKTITDSDVDGSTVTFTIDYSDLATNDGTPVTGVTDGTGVTVDQPAPDTTAPTLAPVSITSDNPNPSLATTGNTVTLSFTSSENILPPTVTFGGVTASTVTGSNTSWSATKTITGADADGPVIFTIAYSDLATNTGTPVTSTDDNTSVTIDQMAPTLTAVSIASNNSNDSSLATTGNTVTLSFTSSEGILPPTVTFGGVAASAVAVGSNTSWSATKTITSGDADGPVAFSISYSDLATNDGTPVTSTDDNTSVTIDQTAPTLALVSITSNNSNPSLATTDDTVTLSFTSSENILPPTVTFGGVTASTVTGSNTSWSATKTITDSDVDGSTVTFTIDYSDLATNDGTPVTGVTDGTGVTVDQPAPDTTAPTLAPVSITSDNPNPSLATTDDTVTLSFTSSENILPPTVTFGGVTASTVTGSNTSWSATKTITSGDADGPVIFTIAYSDLATNTGTPVTSTDDNTSVTIDQTAPTLTAVSITSNNSNDSSLATTGNTVTLSFTSSEGILPPTVTFGGVAASAVAVGSNTSWSATKTIVPGDADGLVAFSISYSDLATNDGTPVTSTIGGSSVTIDQTAPTLALVSITSNNSNPSLATTDDTVTLSFTSSENILPPTVTFGGVTASTVTGSNTSWSATKTITDSDVDGSTVTFTIDYSDLATNDGTPVTGVTDGTGVTVDQPAPDTTAPTLAPVSITSDNPNPSLATTDDTVTLSFTSSENILPPTVTFGGVTASTVTGSNTSWSATKTITSGDADGPVIFTIAYSDLATNTGTPVTSTDDNTSVTIDQMAPTLTAVSITSNNSNDSSLATTGNTVTLSFTSSEGILPPTVTFGGVAASAVAVGSNTSWSATKTIVPEDADGLVAFSISYSDLATNDGTPVTSTIGGSSVTIDQTAPTLALVSITSNNSNPSLATTDDTVTLSFTSSENILPPTVTFGGVTASTVTGSNTSWSATKTITDSDVDGSTVTFTIDYSDLATNDGTPVTGVTDGTGVTVDQPAPDTTAPTLAPVSITSDNPNPSLATTGNTVTLSFTSSENILPPTVTFGGVTASTVTGSNTSWSATKTITGADADGPVIFTIAYSDLATNTGTPVTSTDDNTSVTIDQMAPTLTAVSIASNNSNDSSLATTGNTVTLSFTSSEGILPPTVTFGGVAASAVAVGSNTSWSATKTITSGDADGPVAFSISYSDLATNDGTPVTSTDDNTSVTIDQTAPTLALVSITSNNSNPSLATTDDTVTLSFTSSENILPPTVTFGGVTASTVTGSNTSWSATKTITDSDVDGSTVTFTIDYSDLATNDGTPVTGVTDGTGVTVDQPAPDTTAPTLAPVSITSDNPNPSLATTDDTVTLSFTSSENILPPTVTFGGVTASTVTGSNTSWSATKTITSGDADGPVIFTIAYSDLATNTGTPVTSTDDNTSVTIDQMAPTLTAVSITSNNSNDSSLATTGNTVTLSFTSSEGILPPTVTFGGVAASAVAVGSNTSWSATKTIVPGDADGLVAFSISYSDLATNDGTPVTSTIGGSSVTIDQTAPTLALVSITSNNSNPSLATTDDTVTLSFTSSENILPPTVTFGGVTASTVTGSNTSWSATKTITSGDADGPVIFTIAYSDLATNTGTPVTSTDDNTSVTIDQMAPTLTAVSITSNNSNDSSLATTGNTVTLSFTSSEGILPPTVTFGGVAASAVAVGSNTSWSATKTIVPEDADGLVAFSISYSDLATNDGTPVTSTIGGSSVTIDQTAPTLALVSITSNNSNPSLATTDDTVTLSFTSSENILPPTVTFGGVTASTVTGSNTSWSATKTITDSDVDGSTVTFTIDYSDLATNDGTPVTGVTDGTGVTVDQPAPDTTAPTLAPVSITSDNPNPSLATTGNTVTLSFTSSENILPPTVTFGGVTASTVTGSNTSWSATKTITGADADGPVIFTIAYSDLATNTGTPVTSTDDNTSVTIDQMAPTLTAVSITSNNSNDSSLATTGNTVTLSFTSSEGILPPTVTFGGVAASAVAVGSNTSWSATKTITSGDADGLVAFSISYSDLATNDGTPVTSTDDNTSVTIDQTAPTLALVSITSNNSNPSLATTDDTVTLSFTSSENILPPTVTFGGVTASTVTGSNTSWSATKTITDSDVDGSTVTFTIDYSDLATNDGTPVTGVTDGTGVTVDQPAPDTTAPTLAPVSITSDNPNPSLATTGNTVTLSFTSSENILPPTVTFGGVTASTVTGSNTSWSATKTITSGDADGPVIFTIAYSDLATNTGTPVTSTDDNTSVTIDQTAPTLTAVSITSNNSNDSSLATTGNTVTLSFTSSEGILPPTVTFGGVAASAVAVGSNTSWSATKTIVPGDADGLVAFSISYSDLATNDGTPVTSTIGGSSVTIDQTAPTLALVSITSNNSNPSLATTDDTVTLSFTSSENILPPTVTFGGVTASTVTGSNTSWSATKTITDSDVDGSTVTFTIDYSDLATNDGTPVTGVTDGTGVTVDQPAPDTTAPTLAPVSITSDNPNPSLATTGNTVTLSFTSSENILPPTVTFGGVTASTVTGSNTSWSATKTITGADADGPVIFTIAYSDLATNTGTPVTSTDDNTSVTIDQMAPTLTAVSITSNNSNDSSLATTGNTVTLSFTSSEGILEPVVIINGGIVAATVLGSDDTVWSATRVITPADNPDIVTFAIDYSDLATNDGTPVTGVTDGTGVTVDQTITDTTAPTLTRVSIASDNADTSQATTGDTITLSFESSEPIQQPAVAINGDTVIATVIRGDTTTWSAETTITDADNDGIVMFTIDFSDLALNAGIQVTDTTDNTSVTVDKTAPTRNSGGNDDDSKTRPTFGISRQTFTQIVECGYSMDGVCTDVTEYHVDYNRQIIQTGTAHDFALKVYAQNGMKTFVIGFGVNEVGAPASESEASITVNLGRNYTLDSTYTIDSVEYDNDNNVIGENATFAVSGVSCGGGNDNGDNGDNGIQNQTQCTQLLIDGVLFREAMYDEPFMIEAVDAKRKAIRHYMNEGLQIIGESVNEPPTSEFSNKKTSQSDAVILELTRTDKLKNIWTDQFGYTWSADTPDEWYYVDGPVPDNSSACDSMDHRVCDAFAEKLKYHTSKMESIRDSMYGDIYVAEPFDDLDEVVTFLMTPGESRTRFLDDNAMMWIRN